MYYCCAITDKGIRPNNEDALLIHKTVLTDGFTECLVSAPFLKQRGVNIEDYACRELEVGQSCLQHFQGRTEHFPRTHLRQI